MVSFSLFILCSLILLVQPSSSTQPLNFEPDNIELLGDAHVVAVNDAPSHVHLTHPTPSSFGLLRRPHPLFFAGSTTNFSTEFSFSISGDGSGLLLVLTAAGGNGSDSVAVEFDTSKDDNVGDPNLNHVGIDVGSHMSVAVVNVSDVNLVLNSGEKLNAWVDYNGGYKVLEVRLSKWGDQKPSDPIVSHEIDFSKLWGENPVFAGISSSNSALSVQVVSIYSWRLSLKKASHGLHSLSADRHDLSEDEHRRLCPLTVLAGVIFGTGCVALVTFVVLFMWVIFFQKGPEESLARIPDHTSDIKYERIDVAVDKNPHDDES
ncbi:unnamed protein product [Sphenostylis stenocarpa]|uniref:Legume lectin domain-containing protein n=1 Tax=Sphenostylis stenocarpa TaxID=92480 RepID=A0AA86V2A4_9FABA|nr:unnamed protein product [Sphenostylis stenocarpa]